MAQGVIDLSSIELQQHITELYSLVKKLESLYPGRHFTPDGHMVGSIGECFVAEKYDLKLMPAANKGFDAVTESNIEVEIKATQRQRVAFREEPEHVIVVKIHHDGSIEEIYNGPGDIVWAQFAGKKLPRNGQFQISLTKLISLNEVVSDSQRIKPANKSLRK